MTPLRASPLLRRLVSNMRRSLGKREVAVYGIFLLLLVGLVAFAASSPIAVLVVLGMLWALDHEQLLGFGSTSTSGWARALEAEAKADDETRERRLRWSAHENHDAEEGPWKSDC